MIITNSRYALVGYFTTSYPTQAHGIIVIKTLLQKLMMTENLNKSKLKTNTSTRGKSILNLVTLPSFSISGKISVEKLCVENCKNYKRLYDWGYNAFPQSYKRLQILQFSTYIFSADISPEILKLGRVTKVKVLFLVLVFVFNFSLF